MNTTTPKPEYEVKNMWKQLGKNKKALSSLALILLLLISAIIGGLISYVWVMGYYISLKEKIPGDTVAITNLSFNPQNATAFNVTLLNPSYSPSNNIEVSEIGYSGQNENTLHPVLSSIPTMPFNLSRGLSQTFICMGNLTSYVNQTLAVSAFVVNGSGSTNSIRIPYTQLFIRKIDFNSTIGVQNFTITLQNAPLSAANLTVTTIGIDIATQGAINTTLNPVTPTLPYTLAPNKTVTLSLNYNWSSYASAGGSHQISVLTKEGYAASNFTQIPKLAFSIQQINFNETHTKQFTVTVKNEGSTNTPLNVSRIVLHMVQNNTDINVTTTPPLNASTNGVLGNQAATFMCNWNWTNYRNQNVTVTVYMLQDLGRQSSLLETRPAAILRVTENPTFPDTGHFFVTIQNSQYSIKPANVTRITVTVDSTTVDAPIVQPASGPYLVGIGKTTMFSCAWNWTNYVGKSITILIYTNETGVFVSRIVITPSNASNYRVFLTVPGANFNTTDLTHFNVNVTNSLLSNTNANITRITLLLANGTEIDSTFTPQPLTPSSTVAFTCTWNWATYRNESIVIRVYTNDGLKAIYLTKTP